MRVFFILLIALTVLSESFAQKTVIRGIAPGAELKRIEIIAPADLITYWEQTLAGSVVDSTGNFSLSLDLKETLQVTISIDFHKAELFLEPGKSYDLRIAPMRYDEYTEVDPFIQSQKLSMELADAAPDELNAVIGNFNTVYSAFLMEHFNALYRDRNKTILDTFRIKLNQEFGSYKNPFFVSYATYKFATLEQLTKYHNQVQLARKYFNGVPVLYKNPEYMDFFNSFFGKYMSSSSNILRKIDFRTMIKSPTAYASMMKAMVADTLVKSEQLRELILLKGLMEFYNTIDYPQDDVMAVIRTIGEKSKFNENSAIATNMISLLTHLKPGSPAPEFSLPDRNQKMVSLKNLRGKPIVLNFWTTYCESCLAEMDLLKPLYDKYGSGVYFVSVSADKYFSKMLYFINLKSDYVWKFLNIGDQSDVLKKYDVRSYPLFVLIDQESNIYKFPADLPSNGLEANLQKLLGK